MKNKNIDNGKKVEREITHNGGKINILQEEPE